MAVSVLGPAAATALLLLLTTIPGEAFVFHMAPSLLSTLASSREVSLHPNHSYSAWRRPAVSGRRQEQLRRYCTKRPSGVASLRAEVLPEGGVSPCVIKVRFLFSSQCLSSNTVEQCREATHSSECGVHT